ncbi:MAG TPA: hypothetical protein VK766_06895 [Cytophagaceae bacterium]|jgi:hypothetical protein|nr:hypothetical protein [Cytophagaceae bacterium]
MGKRLQRFLFNEFPVVLKVLSGKNASLVMRDGTTIFGKIIRQEGNRLIVEDKIPRIHSFDLQNIYEILVDSEAPF